MDWARVKRNEWDALKELIRMPVEAVREWGWWTVVGVPVGLAILTVAAAIAGVIAALVLQELGVVDWIQYNTDNPDGEADASDWLRWTLIGYGGFAITGLTMHFGAPLAEEIGEWSRAKERLRQERQREHEEERLRRQ